MSKFHGFILLASGRICNSHDNWCRAFHVFKVFVANPNKPSEIVSILAKNKSKLVTYLSSFQNDKEDLQFIEEKKLLIEWVNHSCIFISTLKSWIICCIDVVFQWKWILELSVLPVADNMISVDVILFVRLFYLVFLKDDVCRWLPQ